MNVFLTRVKNCNRKRDFLFATHEKPIQKLCNIAYLYFIRHRSKGLLFEHDGVHWRAEIFPDSTSRNDRVIRNKFLEQFAIKRHLWSPLIGYYKFRGEVVEEIRSATAKQAVAAFLLTIVLSISPILLILIRKITGTIQVVFIYFCIYCLTTPRVLLAFMHIAVVAFCEKMYSMDLSTKTAALRREKRRSDKLLNQMLPLEVIKQVSCKWLYIPISLMF